MKCASLFLLALSATAAVNAVATTTGSPVEKVVHLLQDLQAQIEMDGKKEQMMMNKLACWCEKATKAKAEAIERAQDELRAMGQEILSLKGKIAVLTAEIEQLEEDIKANIKAQDEATAVRTKENAEYMAESLEMKQAMAALDKAIKVLIAGTTKKGTAALLQGSALRSTLASLIEVLPQKANLKPEQVSLLNDVASGKVHSKYTPQSLTVQGILVEMYETFAEDLETMNFDESTKNREFEDFIATKEAELIEFKELKAKKEDKKADAETTLAEVTQSYDDTKGQMEADIAFFDENKQYCLDTNEQWTVRDAARKQELEGIKKAIEILSSDEARELFGSAIKPGKEVGADTETYQTGVDIDSFLQVGTASSLEAPNMKAYSTLKAVAGKLHSLRMAQLAVQVRAAKAGHFDKVIKAIDEMIETLKEEAKDDMEKLDQCKEEYTKINSTVSDLEWKIKNNVAKIDKLEALIEKRTEEKLQTIEDINKTAEEIKSMEEQRVAENQDFLAAKKEDKEAIALLMEARDVLEEYYKNHTDMGPMQGEAKGVLLQKEEPTFAISNTSRPDVDFSPTHTHAVQAKGILQIITMIIEDLNDEIANGIKAETATQLEFEKQLKAAKDLKEQLIQKKINLEEAIAKRTEEKTQEIEIKEGNEVDLKDELKYKATIKPDCDWIIGAFDERYKKREAEMNGLVSAKDFLANGHLLDDEALLQGRKKQDKQQDQSGRLLRLFPRIHFRSLAP